jgi:hypothetical protein
MLCKSNSAAEKRYRRDILRFMAAYVVVLFCSSWFVKHDGSQRFFLYFWSVMPAIPVLAVMIRMGRYLQEEKDEYLRLMAMQAILVGTAALLGTLVVTDFLRTFANTGALPPFLSFIIFCAGMAATQAVQKLRNRVADDE